MIQLTLRVPDNLHQAIQSQVERDGLTVAQVLRSVLADHYKVPLDVGDCRVFQIPYEPPVVPSYTPVTSATLSFVLVESLRVTIRGGLFIQAIKDLRVASGLGLYEAKTVIDTLRQEEGLL